MSPGSPRERALLFLWTRLEAKTPMGGRMDRAEDWGPKVTGWLGALAAAGWISDGERAVWEARLLTPGEPAQPARIELQGAAPVLDALLDAVPADDDGTGDELNRFEGAVAALAAVGAVDAEAWDRRLRERLGWPTAEEEEREMRELNAGGTEQELLRVLPGSEPAADGTRVLYGLSFADGVSLFVHRPQAARAQLDWGDLTDDLGTEYSPAGAGGGDHELRVGFRTPIPEGASRIELNGIGPEPLRVTLR